MDHGKCSTWAIVLAGGDGTRLRALTTDGAGTSVPKQFCSLDGQRSMVRVAIGRACQVVPVERVLVVVTEAHRPFWSAQLGDLPPDNVVVQPENRGTAPGLLLPLLRILARDPAAAVLVLPSDHHLEREEVFLDAARRALEEVRPSCEDVALLGVEADYPEVEYGWIVPSTSWRGPLRAIREFVEKPDAARCERLYRGGALWNCFVIAATVPALMGLYARQAGCLLAQFVDAAQQSEAGTLERLYGAIPPADVSRDLLTHGGERLSVMRVPSCGFTDLGSPERVARCADHVLGRRRSVAAAEAPPGMESLASRAAELARSA